jgi:hypothetical protein
MKWTPWAWLAAVGFAFVIGRNSVHAADPVAAEPTDAPSCSVPAVREHRSLVAQWRPRENARQVDTTPKRAPKRFELSDHRDLDAVSHAMMLYAEQKLKEGPEGHFELLETIDREFTKKHGEMNRLADPSQAARELYPWLRFMVEHESEMVALTETVFETMASDPQRFADFDHDTLEAFTEGMAFLLPGAVSESTLERFSGYAQTVIDTPSDQLPPAVQDQLGDLARSVALWAPPLTAEEKLVELSKGPSSSAEMERFLRGLDSDALAGVDALQVFGRQLDRGDLSSSIYIDRFALDPNTIALLDDRLLFGSGVALQASDVFLYLAHTGRASPDLATAFWVRAESSPHAEVFAQARRQTTIIY